MSALLWTLAAVCWGLAAVLVASLSTRFSIGPSPRDAKKPRR